MSETPADMLGPAESVGHNLPEYTVGEISAALKRTLEQTYGRVRVRGEISGFKRAASGHLYMTLKDDAAVIDGVCWRGTAGRLHTQPEDGMEVIATGRISTYAGRSKYQIIIDDIELAGEGALLKLLEDRRKKLAAEGLFDEDRKRPLPFLPDVIGVVTSPTGAVIRDILHRLADRFPRRVLVWPVRVQGDGAAEEIAAAIDGFAGLPAGGPVPRPDVVIVARGGGSLEDLWAFNEEIVVRAAAACPVPLISAVGHETDTTLIDFVADRRAPTPTAAAEMAVPVRAELLSQVGDDGTRLTSAANRLLAERRSHVEGLARGLPEPRALLETNAQRLDDATERLANGAALALERRGAALVTWAARLTHPGQQLAQRRERLANAAKALDTAVRQAIDVDRTLKDLGRFADRLDTAWTRALAEADKRLDATGKLLESLSYERVLDRGYALVSDTAGHPVTSAAAAHPGMDLTIRLADGAVGARVTGKAAAGTAAGEAPPRQRRTRRKRHKSSSDDPQGSLL